MDAAADVSGGHIKQRAGMVTAKVASRLGLL